MKIKMKTNKCDLIQLKSFCTMKATISKVKRQTSEGEKIIANEKIDKELITKIDKQLNTRKTSNLIKKWAKDVNRHFSKEGWQMINGRWKDAQHYSFIQFSSVAQSCPTLCDPMNHSTPGLPVHHQLPEFTQTNVHRVSDAIEPSHPLSSPSTPAPNPSQHQSLFQWVNSSHEVAKVLKFQL